LREIEKETIEFAAASNLNATPEFVSDLRDYFEVTTKNIPKIEVKLNSKVAPQEVTLVFRQIGQSAVRASLARNGSEVTMDDFHRVLYSAKGSTIGPCSNPNCFNATASLIARNRDILIED